MTLLHEEDRNRIEHEREALRSAARVRVEWAPDGDCSSVIVTAILPDGAEQQIGSLVRLDLTADTEAPTRTRLVFVDERPEPPDQFCGRCGAPLGERT